MKKTLLTFFVIVSSCFFTYAQFQAQGTIDGKPVGYNSQSGVLKVGNGAGGGVQINTQTGKWDVAGTLNGININLGTGGGFNTQGNYTGILGIIALAQRIVSRLVPLLIGVAVLAFFWFLIEFIWKGKDSPEEQQKGKAGMFWSMVALFVMVSVWGIVTFIGTTLGITQGGGIHGFVLPGATK